MLFFLLTAVLCEEVALNQVLAGKWNITVVDLDKDGIENTEFKSYEIELAIKEGNLEGDVIGEDEEGILSTFMTLGIAPKAEENGTFILSSIQEDNAEEIAKFKLNIGVDGLMVASGQLTDEEYYQLNFVSKTTIEITVYNKKTSLITLYRCIKKVPKTKQNFLLQFLPMISMFVMMFLQNKANPAAAQAQPAQGQAAPAGGDHAKTD